MPTSFQSLLSAILDDDRARVKRLIKAEPAVAVDGRETKARLEPGISHWIYVNDTALHVAAAGYRAEIVKMLLLAGADPDSALNHRRSGPLHYAADGCLESPNWDPKRQVSVIRLLLAAGADIHAQDKNGATPLHRAVRTRSAAAVAALLEAGADPEVHNQPGSTPFHLAVQNTGRGGSGTKLAREAQRQIIKTFLARGISLQLKDRSGKPVFDWARSDAIRRLLLEDS